MKFSVLVLDYDGTLARDGKTDPTIVHAIREARSRGITVILATGRILSELRRVLDERDLFDAIVAENGAVLAFPSGRTRLLGHAPPRQFLDELRRRKIKFGLGDCVVEADADAAPKILKVIRELRLPLMLAFNSARVMVLPQGITKAAGLREALKTLRLSLHSAIGIGDAENDHALIEACEIGVAVGWGSSSLQKIADEVLKGSWPDAIANYIRQVSAQTKLPPHRVDSRRILLGHTREGELVESAVHGHNILIAGDPRSGKSWITGLFCEQLILQDYSLCVIDPEGDYATLESLPNVVVFGRGDPAPRWSEIERTLRYPDASLVLDLSHLGHEEKVGYVADLLPALARLRRRSGLPHWIVIDEAHYFLNDCHSEPPVDLELLAYLLVTYRASQLCSGLLRSVETIVATPLTEPDEVKALATICGAKAVESEWSALFADLGIDEAALLPAKGSAECLPRRFIIAERITPHVRHRAKYLDVPMPAGHAFTFTSHGQPVGPPARTLKEFATLQEQLQPAAIEEHARHSDFSRWIGEVFGDQPLAVAIAHVEEQYRRGRVANLPKALVRPIRERYEIAG